ncbi:Fis family transcriptional regulator [Pseudoalteromonas luteoviolacea]|uniref:Fis family transcriptional regulator n=1 Tax=Pseudoalteromonas luteoviolacea TaxID=43657 RepID=UPI001F22F6FD|nr:Fis family transcriptional regulator [Pseudoalteromonas luteoviolacea]MCF6441847.1 Fis family transcriptional regulator [Pseudoalteromonas luteoviolacea]
MRKSDKKLEKDIVAALTEACEDALKVYKGFEWLTHVVNYQNFPGSLTVVCIFDNQESLNLAMGDDKGAGFKSAIERKLIEHNIKIKGVTKRILFDTEEACNAEHNGNWSKRLDGVQHARHV